MHEHLNILITSRWVPKEERDITPFILYGFVVETSKGFVYELRSCDDLRKIHYQSLNINFVLDAETFEAINDTYEFLKLKYGA